MESEIEFLKHTVQFSKICYEQVRDFIKYPDSNILKFSSERDAELLWLRLNERLVILKQLEAENDK
jgi:hypothetical protein